MQIKSFQYTTLNKALSNALSNALSKARLFDLDKGTVKPSLFFLLNYAL